MPYKAPSQEFDQGDLHAGTRVCRECALRQDIQNFNWAGKSVRVRVCKECQKKARKSPKRSSEELLELTLRTEHGITVEGYKTLWELQKGLCAICERALQRGARGGNAAHVDHDHETNEIRGLLCFTCNTALGKFLDSEKLLEAALAYLRKDHTEIERRSKTLSKAERTAISKKRWKDHGSLQLQARAEKEGRTITKKIVQSFIDDYETGEYTYAQLASKYDVPKATIGYYVRQARRLALET